MSAKKDMKKAIKACEAAGLVYDPTHAHPRITNPATGRFVSISNTPGGPYAYRQMLRDVRKYLGIEVNL